MVLKLLEGFDDNLANQRLGGSWEGPSATYGLHGDGIRVGDIGNDIAYIPVDDGETNFVGFACKFAGNDGQFIAFGSGSGVELDLANQRLHGFVQTGVSGQTTHVYTPIGSITGGSWHYIEVKVFHSTSSAGILQLGVDGTYTAESTGIDWYYEGLAFELGGTLSQFVDYASIDDLYIADGTGTVNNTFLGPTEVVTLYPDGNGNSSDLLGSDADYTDNYLLVDENPPDDGTTYVGSGVEGEKDTYTFDDMTGTGSVSGLIVSANAKKTDTGSKFIRPVARLSSTDYTSDTKSLSETYGPAESVFDENPDASAAWTITTVNAAEFGIEVRSS